MGSVMPGPLKVFVQFFVLGLTSFGGPVAVSYTHLTLPTNREV